MPRGCPRKSFGLNYFGLSNFVLIFLSLERLAVEKKQHKHKLLLGTRWPFTGVSRALRARNPEKVWKKSPRASGPGTPRESGKSLENVRRVWKKSRKGPKKTCSRLFPDFFGVSGPEVPRDPCKWPTGSQNFLGRIPCGRTPGKEPFSRTQKVYARPFLL